MIGIQFVLIFLGFLGFFNSSFAQDPQFSQFYASPIYLNPALVGTSQKIRISTGIRQQYTGIKRPYQTQNLSIDFPISNQSSLGFMANQDVAGIGDLTTRSLNGVYGYQLRMNRKWAVNLAVQGGIVQRTLDFSKLTFGDQYDPRYGLMYQTNEQFQQAPRIYGNFAAGATVFSEKVFAGVAAHNLFRPNPSFTDASQNQESYRIDRRYTLHFGTQIEVTSEREESERTILSPNVVFMEQAGSGQMNVGFYATKNSLVGGLWYRQTKVNSDAAILMVGLKLPKLRVGYSYDVTISRAKTSTVGSHELTLAVELTPKKKVRTKSYAIPCPRL